MRDNDLQLYLVTNRYEDVDEVFLRKIDEACRAGVTMVQLREKDVSTRRFHNLACQVKSVTDRHQVPLIINDRVDICLAVDASGVHIGDDDLPIAVVRQLIGANKLLGVSAKTVKRACEAERAGADYLGVGTMFPTRTKVNTQATSLDTLTNMIRAVDIPVVAIGGIDEDKLAVFKQTGIAGVAVVSRIMTAQNITQVVTAFQNRLNQILGGHVDD